MKRHWITGLICISVFFFYLHCSQAQDAQGPEMVLKQQVFNFEEVKEGEIIEHTFQVLNRGDETLNIIRVKPG